MTVSVSPNETDVLTALRSFLLSVMPDGSDVVQGEQNLVPEPGITTFGVMWPIMRPRLSTNADGYVDTIFTASIAAGVLTVSAIDPNSAGLICEGASLFGVGVADGSKIGAQISGPTGGTGTYAVTPSQTVASKQMASGDLEATQETEIVVQLDVHGPSLAIAGNAVAAIATMFRDDYACRFFEALSPAITPLFSDDPRQVPFVNGEQQVEIKWTVDLHLQANQTVSGIPQQFADQAAVGLINVDAVYPA
jgi:hypothetical protein